MKQINYNKHYIDYDDILSVKKVLKSNFLTQGNEVIKFEKSLSKFFGGKYCSAVSSGTAALHLLAISLNWKKGDYIIAPAISFIATSNCIIHQKATPIFVDINLKTYTLDVNKIDYWAKKLGKKLKAVIGVDYAGHPCDWKYLQQLSKKYRFKLINDNCHALGSKIDNKKNYALKYAHYVIQSFHPVKNITTAEGGALITNDKRIYQKFKLLGNQGILKNIKKNNISSLWYYEMRELGYNYRLNEIQSALGNSQLKKLSDFIKKRRSIANLYNKYLQNIDIFETPKELKNNLHSYHLYPLIIDFSKTKKNKKILFENLLKKYKIRLQVHYIPIYNHPYYKKNYKTKKLLNTEFFYKNVVSLPIYYKIKSNDVKYIVNSIKSELNIK
tara:strand:+ start:1477 stop:2634 length:1158 start_codon:yes stop_codon:yes gene_type:complete